MAHALIASPFLDGHLLLKPGARAGARISADHYEGLRQAAAGESLPTWAVQTASDVWGLDLGGRPAQGTVLVREPSPYGYCRASWEINLGCNFGCKHCYLGVRPFSGLAWDDKVRLLDIMREAGCPLAPDHRRRAHHGSPLPGCLPVRLAGRDDAHHLHQRLAALAARPPQALPGLPALPAGGQHVRGERGVLRHAHPAPWRVESVPARHRRRARGGSAAAHQRRGDRGQRLRGRRNGRPRRRVERREPRVHEHDAHDLRRRRAAARPVRRPPATAQAVHGCNAGHTFFHADPHAKVSICKVGRDDQIDLMAEGIDGLTRLGAIADRLMLRTGGCEGCALSGTCRVCRPLAKHYQEAKAPLHSYCQHGDKENAS